MHKWVLYEILLCYLELFLLIYIEVCKNEIVLIFNEVIFHD